MLQTRLRLPFFVLLSAIVILLLAACGGSSETSFPGSPTAMTETPDVSQSGPDANEANVDATPSPTPTPDKRIVAIDPGHGNVDYGVPLGVVENGEPIQEKKLVLEIAQLVKEKLEPKGYKVVLARTGDTDVNIAEEDLNGDGEVGASDDLQARVDFANSAGADVFISLHLNGLDDPSVSGTETFYCDARPFADENLLLASSVQNGIVSTLRGYGYDVVDRGTTIDSDSSDPRHLAVLGPATEKIPRPSEMPGVLIEALYMSNQVDGHMLGFKDVRGWIAEGIASGIDSYFESQE